VEFIIILVSWPAYTTTPTTYSVLRRLEPRSSSWLIPSGMGALYTHTRRERSRQQECPSWSSRAGTSARKGGHDTIAFSVSLIMSASPVSVSV
jgi:hypothetical protein